MKKIIVSALSFMLFSTISFAQTAEEVVNKYLTAIGGVDAIAKIKDTKMAYTGEVQGAALDLVISQKAGKFAQTVNVAGMGEVMKMQCNGTKIHINSMQTGDQDITDADLVKAISANNASVPESGYSGTGAKLTFVAKEPLNDKTVYKIDVLIGKDKVTNYYDTETGLKLRTIASMNGQAVTIDYSDYKEVSGVKFPHKMNQDIGMFQIAYVASKIEVNTNLDDAIFEIK